MFYWGDKASKSKVGISMEEFEGIIAGSWTQREADVIFDHALSVTCWAQGRVLAIEADAYASERRATEGSGDA